jgi:hypothetical protein
MAKVIAKTIREIMDDMRSGLGDVPIMEKYQISPEVFSHIKRQFRLEQQISRHRPVATSGIERRLFPRQEPLYRITVSDEDDPRIRGIILDIHTKGIGTVGMTVWADEMKTLVIRSKPFNAHATFRFEAKCQWSMINDWGECVAGFSITRISPADGKELKKFIDKLTLSSEEPKGRKG